MIMSRVNYYVPGVIIVCFFGSVALVLRTLVSYVVDNWGLLVQLPDATLFAWAFGVMILSGIGFLRLGSVKFK